MTTLIILNEAPYAGERAFNAMRTAAAMCRQADAGNVRVFLMSDGVYCALPNQLRPDGSINIEHLLTTLIGEGVEVKACTTCLDQRGMFNLELIRGVAVASLADLSKWVVDADHLVTF